jgi:hypothetical protein
VNRAIRSLIARAKRQEREHVRHAKWCLRHGSYVEAARSLAWALQQQAFREGLERATSPTGLTIGTIILPKIRARRGRKWS